MKWTLWLALFGAALISTGVASAQVDTSSGVARISLVHGDVSTQRGDTNEWSAAALNQPMVAGDKVSTGDRSRAEVQLDHGNILRLGNNSQANIANLTRTNIQVQVGQGLAYYSVYRDSEAEIEIDTPNVSVRPTSKDGVYRIEVNGGQTQVTVRKGSADISTPQGSERVERGQSAIVRGTAEEAEYKITGAPSKDGWDSWNSERDGVIRNAQSWSRTSAYYVGSEDLDAYGRWVDVPDYGYVWQPVVGVGWAPYRAGRWVWEPYWGWTWVSYEPWGWAPYHYGRWFLYGGSWAWWPGPSYPFYRPIWAPAYVSFFGFGGHWGVSVGFGFGSVGWLPIGPCDRFYPWWGGYRSRFNTVNVTNITNITNITNVGRGIEPLHGGNKFSNLRQVSTNDAVRRGISTVPAEHFGTGRSRPGEVTKESFHNGRMLAGNVPIVPTRAATSVTERPASAATMHGGQQKFFSKTQPAGRPESFDRQAAQVQESIQQHGRGAGAQSGVPAGARVNMGAEASKQSAAQADRASGSVQENSAARSDGFRRFGGGQGQNRATESPARPAFPATPAGQRNDVQAQRHEAAAAPQADRSAGWRKFSDSNPGQGRNQSAPAQQPRATTPAPQNEYRTARPAGGGVTQSPTQNERSVDRGAGWQKFTPAANRSENARGRVSAEPAYRGEYSGGARASESYSQGYSRPQPAYNEANRGRPPLELRRPIVTPRPAEASPARSSGGYSNHGGGGGGGGGGGRSSGGGGGRSSGGGGQSHSSGNKSR